MVVVIIGLEEIVKLGCGFDLVGVVKLRVLGGSEVEEMGWGVM